MKHETKPFDQELRATQFALERLANLYCELEKRTHRLERIISLQSKDEA